MDFFLEDPDQICRSLNICKTQNCVKLHPRFLSGACNYDLFDQNLHTLTFLTKTYTFLQKGYEYFEQLRCLGCNKPYELKEWFTKDQYTSGIYYCKLCQKKKNI